jgi:hypothetical protein
MCLFSSSNPGNFATQNRGTEGLFQSAVIAGFDDVIDAGSASRWVEAHD